jgi:hypothetical protein
MRRPPPLPIVLTSEELEVVKNQAFALGRSQCFSAEEMQAIREQYELRILDEEQRREQVEWHLKIALARLKDVDEALRACVPDDPRRDARRMPMLTSKRARA